MNLSFYLHTTVSGGRTLSEEARKLVESAAAIEVSKKVALGGLAATIQRIYQGNLRGEAPRKTGKLINGIRATREPLSGGIIIHFRSTAPYTRYVIEGTKPHVIRPKRAKTLRFTLKGGQVVFARQVNHPGTKPNPFQERAWTRAQPAIQAALALAGTEILLSFQG